MVALAAAIGSLAILTESDLFNEIGTDGMIAHTQQVWQLELLRPTYLFINGNKNCISLLNKIRRQIAEENVRKK
jgi:hypothetical protein